MYGESYNLVRRNLNGHGGTFVNTVRVERPTEGREILKVRDKDVSQADGNQEMRDGHLAALADWIETE